jgi:hypothetical protein
VHDLSCETCLTRYSLRGVMREPISATTALALGSTLAAGGISAAGTLAGGRAAQRAGTMQATSALAGAELAASAAEAGGAMSAGYQRRGADMSARAAEIGSEHAAATGLAAGDLAATGAERRGRLLGQAKRLGGRLTQEAREFEAVQAEREAGTTRAAAQRAALDRRRDIKLTLSALQARAAASGGASDDSVARLAARMAERGEYEALGEMFSGENRARGIEDVAAGLRFSGAAARIGSELDALGAEYEGRSTAQAARFTSGAQAGAELLRGRIAADTARFQGESLATITEHEARTSAAATRFTGAANAQAARMGGNAAQSASQFSALGTILGSAGTVARWTAPTPTFGTPASLPSTVQWPY